MRCLLLAAVVLVMAACGGSPDRRLSKIEYVLHAQAIERNDEPAAVGPFEDVVGHDLPRPYCVKRLHDLRDALQKLVDDARGLNPPRRLERLHDDFLVDAQASVDAVGAVA